MIIYLCGVGVQLLGFSKHWYSTQEAVCIFLSFTLLQPCPHSTTHEVTPSFSLSLSCIHLFHGPVEGCECYQGRVWCGAACLALVHHGCTQATFQACQSRDASYRGPSCRPNCRITAWRMASYQVFKPSGRSICWRIWEVWSSRVMNGEKRCCQSGLPLAVSLLCCLSFLFSFPQPETALSSLTKSLFSLLLFFSFSYLLVGKKYHGEFKGIVHPEKKIMSSCPHPRVDPDLNNFLPWNNFWWISWPLFTIQWKQKKHQKIIIGWSSSQNLSEWFVHSFPQLLRSNS